MISLFSTMQTLTYSTGAYSTTIIWSTVELGVGIFCASLPVMRPILHKLNVYVPTMEGTSTKASTNTFHRPSHATNFRMRSYRNSGGWTDADDVNPFAEDEFHTVTQIRRHDSQNRSRSLDLESGHAAQSISITTKIEQERDEISSQKFSRNT